MPVRSPRLPPASLPDGRPQSPSEGRKWPESGTGTAAHSPILGCMGLSRKFRTSRHLVTVLGATLVVAGAGVALARTSSGPPWAQASPYCTEATGDTTAVTDTAVATDVRGTADCVEFDRSQVQKKVDDYFQAVDNDCGTAVLGEANLSNADTAKAFDTLVTALDSGQKDHMVQSVRRALYTWPTCRTRTPRRPSTHSSPPWIRDRRTIWFSRSACSWPTAQTTPTTAC